MNTFIYAYIYTNEKHIYMCIYIYTKYIHKFVYIYSQHYINTYACKYSSSFHIWSDDPRWSAFFSLKPPSRGNSPNETVSRRGNDSVSLWHSYKQFGGHFVQAIVSLAPPLTLSCGLKWETIDPEIWVCLSCGNLPQVTSIYVIGNIWTFWPVGFRATWCISRQIHMSDVSPGRPGEVSQDVGRPARAGGTRRTRGWELK